MQAVVELEVAGVVVVCVEAVAGYVPDVVLVEVLVAGVATLVGADVAKVVQHGGIAVETALVAGGSS